MSRATETPVFGPTSVIQTRRNRTAGILGLVALAAALGAIANPLTAFSMLTGLGAFIGIVSWLAFYRPVRRRIDLAADMRGVTADGVLVRDRRFIRNVTVTSTPDGRWRVDVLSWFSPRLRLELSNPDEVRDLLAALGRDRRVGTTTFSLRTFPSPSAGGVAFFAVAVFFGSCFVSTFAIGHFYATLIAPIALAVLVSILNTLITRRRLAVGADGIEIRSIFRRRMIPHREIAQVTRFETYGEIAPGFVIRLASGKTMTFDTRRERIASGNHLGDPAYDAAFQAWLTSRQHEQDGKPMAAHSLARGGRPIKEWIKALRDLATTRGNYRVAAVDDATLFDMLRDAAAAPEVRAAAAIALGSKPEHLPRLRVAADNLADDAVRRVTLRVAEGEPLDDLEGDLDALDERKASTLR